MPKTAAVPFRTEIRTSSSGAVSIDEARRLFTEIPDLSFKDAARHPDELVAWLVGHRLLREPGDLGSDYARRVEKRYKKTAPLVDRALRDADDEGLVWTPLLDILAESFDWICLADGKIKRSDGSTFPNPHERAAGLTEWIRTRTHAQELAPLLAFRSEVVRCILAGEARVFDDSLIDHVAATIRSANVALKNEAAPEDLRDRALSAAYDRLRNRMLALKAEKPDKYGSYYPVGFVETIFLKENAATGLPEPLRKRIEGDLNGQLSDCEPILAILAEDPNTPRDVLETIIRNAFFPVQARALLHPNSNIARIKRALEESRDPDRLASEILLLNSPRITADVLRMLLDHCVKDIRTVQSIAIHPAATPDMRREIVQRYRSTELFESMTHHSAVLSDPVVRATLATSRSKFVLSRLLKHATPEEYPNILYRLAQVSIEEAISVVRRTPPPEGTVFPEKVVARLLRAPRAEDRLTVLTQIVGRSATASVTTSRETRQR